MSIGQPVRQQATLLYCLIFFSFTFSRILFHTVQSSSHYSHRCTHIIIRKSKCIIDIAILCYTQNFQVTCSNFYFPLYIICKPTLPDISMFSLKTLFYQFSLVKSSSVLITHFKSCTVHVNHCHNNVLGSGHYLTTLFMFRNYQKA